MDTILDDLTKKLEDLKREVDLLREGRVYQYDVVPGIIKNRAMGEPNSYIYSGLAANRPTTGKKLTTTGFGCSIWWSTNTHVLSIWDGTQWRTVTLS